MVLPRKRISFTLFFIYFLFDVDGKVSFWYEKTKATEVWVKKSTKH